MWDTSPVQWWTAGDSGPATEEKTAAAPGTPGTAAVALRRRQPARATAQPVYFSTILPSFGSAFSTLSTPFGRTCS